MDKDSILRHATGFLTHILFWFQISQKKEEHEGTYSGIRIILMSYNPVAHTV